MSFLAGSEYDVSDMWASEEQNDHTGLGYIDADWASWLLWLWGLGPEVSDMRRRR